MYNCYNDYMVNNNNITCVCPPVAHLSSVSQSGIDPERRDEIEGPFIFNRIQLKGKKLFFLCLEMRKTISWENADPGQ